MKTRKIVALLSGGLDSLTAAAWAAKRLKRKLYALTINYGQRHVVELQAARKAANFLNVERHIEININLDEIGGSALTDQNLSVPKNSSAAEIGEGVPITYVPARNTIFLSLALGWAEKLGASEIVIGVNALDYSGYPDCRPEFIRSFERLAALATKAGTEGEVGFKVHVPLIDLSKAEIIKLGLELGVDYSITHSCYDPLVEEDERSSGETIKSMACGKCDSCLLRLKGFAEAGVKDPVFYAAS